MFCLHVLPGDGFRREVEVNARMGKVTPERWLSAAVSHFAALLASLKKGNGFLVVGKDDEILRFEDEPIGEYRKRAPLRVVPGIRPQDLGGYPAGTVIWKVGVADEVAQKLHALSGAGSPEEAVGYAIWRQSRFANTLREDYPDWEPGFVLADGIFRSMAVAGAMRRSPGEDYEPVVAHDLPIGGKIRTWLGLLTGLEPGEVELGAQERENPIFRNGAYYCPMGGSPGARPARWPAKALETRPMTEIVLLGPSPAEASSLVAAVYAHAHRKPQENFRLSMPDLLSDPAPLAEMRAFLGNRPASALVMTAGVVGCLHGLRSSGPCGRCPGWGPQ